MACRNIKADQQKRAIFWGSFGAIAIRILLTGAAAWVLQIPFLQIAGGMLLVYIAIKLLKNDENEDELHSSDHLWKAIKTIISADLIMSLDNVLAVAGAAGGSFLLIGLGLAISVPLIIWGSQLLTQLMQRFPIIVVLGTGLLGYTAGEMIVDDKATTQWFPAMSPQMHYFLPAGLALTVIVVGKLQAKRNEFTKENFEQSA
ncbi:MAG: rane protein [Paenibacillus sp.]|nr:rane protein [Paenibacillus sp.]